jgi:hypothetical protein
MNTQHNVHLWLGGAVMVACLLGPSARNASGETRYWDEVLIGWWNDPDNWSPVGEPVTGDRVRILADLNETRQVLYRTDLEDQIMSSITIDGEGTAGLSQGQDALWTANLIVGENYEGTYQITGGGLLIDAFLVLGEGASSEGALTLAGPDAYVDAGISDYAIIGGLGSGHVDHQNGTFIARRLQIGHDGSGLYELQQGLLDADLLEIGLNDDGTVEQTGGEAIVGENGMTIGLNSLGAGAYNMLGGSLVADHIVLAEDGNGFMLHVNGTVETVDGLSIGADGTHSLPASYRLTSVGELSVGDDLHVGQSSRGDFIVEGGEATVTGLLWVHGPAATHGTLDQTGGTITTPDFMNGGQTDVRGGVFEAETAVNDSSVGLNVFGSGDARINTLTNEGLVSLDGNGYLRGEQTPFGYRLCDFANEGEFIMDDGTFVGHLINNGYFEFNGGDFSAGQLTHNGTIDFTTSLTADRIVNNGDLRVPPGITLSATTTDFAESIVNNGHLVLAGSDISATRGLTNNGWLEGYGRVFGNVQNESIIAPGLEPTQSAVIQISGELTQGPDARITLTVNGTAPSAFDRIVVDQVAYLAGRLDFARTSLYFPQVGDEFIVLEADRIEGEFDEVVYYGPVPDDRRYRMTQTGRRVVIDVVAAGDGNGDGSVDLGDHVVFADCMAGPNARPTPTLAGATAEGCLSVFDHDFDRDVDLEDFGPFSQLLTGP